MGHKGAIHLRENLMRSKVFMDILLPPSGERAIDLLARGKGDEVRVAAKAFIDGAYV